MLKKILCPLLILFVVLVSQSQGRTFSPGSPLEMRSEQGAKDEKSQEIEKELKRLLEEVKKLEKDAREKVQKDILPRIRKEIEKLRKWLKEFSSSDDDTAPRKI